MQYQDSMYFDRFLQWKTLERSEDFHLLCIESFSLTPVIGLSFFSSFFKLSLVFLFKAAHHQTSIPTIQTAGQGGIRGGEKLHLKKEHPVMNSTTLKSIQIE